MPVFHLFDDLAAEAKGRLGLTFLIEAVCV